jgi:hypothetical protein
MVLWADELACEIILCQHHNIIIWLSLSHKARRCDESGRYEQIGVLTTQSHPHDDPA